MKHTKITNEVEKWQKILIKANNELRQIWSFYGDKDPEQKRQAIIQRARNVLTDFRKVKDSIQKTQQVDYEYDLEYFYKQIEERLKQIDKYKKFRTYFNKEESQLKIKSKPLKLPEVGKLAKKLKSSIGLSSIQYKELALSFGKNLGSLNDDLYALTEGRLKSRKNKIISEAKNKLKQWEELLPITSLGFQEQFKQDIEDMKGFLEKLS